jgi:hypothetical protein
MTREAIVFAIQQRPLSGQDMAGSVASLDWSWLAPICLNYFETLNERHGSTARRFPAAEAARGHGIGRKPSRDGAHRPAKARRRRSRK